MSSSNKTKPNNSIIIDKSTQRLHALESHVKPKEEIAIDGTAHTAAQVMAIYQAAIDTRALLAKKRAEVKAAMVERANAEAKRRAADRALKPWVINKFGATSQEAHEFGFPPPKAPSMTAEQRAEAVLLAKATRQARHTMGKKQKQDIKGTIDVPTAPAAPATHPTPAAPPAASSPVNGVSAQAPAPITNGITNGIAAHA